MRQPRQRKTIRNKDYQEIDFGKQQKGASVPQAGNSDHEIDRLPTSSQSRVNV
jgi:hypothetical protein